MNGASFVLSGGTYRLEVVGDLDLQSTPAMVAAALTPRRARDLVIDLSQVTFLDAAGVGGLLAVRSGLGSTGRRLHLAGASPRTVRVLVLTRTEFLLDRYPRPPELRILDELTAAIVVAVRAAPRTVRNDHDLAATR